MGKQGFPRSPRPEHTNFNLPFGLREMQKGGDPSIGKRVAGGDYQWNKVVLFHGLKNDSAKLGACKGGYPGKRHAWFRRHVRSIIFTIALMGFLFLLDSLLISAFDPASLKSSSTPRNSIGKRGSTDAHDNNEKTEVQMYDRLLNLASSALAEREFKKDLSKLWEEPYPQASLWRPCADREAPKSAGKLKNSTGFILISANGGLNQQRVAVCNAVAVASLLNATLVIPKFLYSNVWKDPSQFGDIYQEEYFTNTLKNEVDIVKELPPHLRSLDLVAIGSQITDAEIPKEASPHEYVEIILPLLLRNGIVHFLGFGNRLGFDPVPSELQRLRCKCNFHALKFVPKIQEVGSLLIRRIRKHDATRSMLDKQLLGNFISNVPLKGHDTVRGHSKYLAVHLRFEVDMVAYSLCEFGGGEAEKNNLQAYREIHFPLLIERLKKLKPVIPAELRKLGKCPLTPEAAALVLAGLGYKRGTYIYLAGSHIYGGQSRMHPLTSLYPNLVTKEDLLTPSELVPFRNFSSQMAALDYIACATADVFAITDSGSQLSSLVSGFRTYYGGGRAPTLKPSKKRLAAILSESSTIGWNSFAHRVKKMIEEGQRVRVRGFGRSIYRQPRCPECMCRS
ncbi:hypothetical protein RJ639_040592 [Escallonia herrerae]|uniref:O-fucosyltransferase family protein n=1 Tax=Escallonia herrerae TaxID=1293975 RepID=A0AA88WJG1_9ASTE|nr:hypothetical protein RJ639_040592 [Escallonia herrerae]